MKTNIAIISALLIAVSSSGALAKSSKHQWKNKGYHGASYYAPGHVKKRLALQSARSVSPGHIKRWW